MHSDQFRYPERLVQLRANLRQYRELLGMTQEEVAERLGMTIAGYGSFERGRTMVSGERRDLALALETELGEIVERRRLLLGPSSDKDAETPAKRPVTADTICPRCQSPVLGPQSGYSYCGHYGIRLGAECPNGHVVPLGALYCPTCGSQLQGGARDDSVLSAGQRAGRVE